MGPGLCTLARSKLVKFRFSGTPQRCRLGWACVLCPSFPGLSNSGDQVLASTLSLGALHLLRWDGVVSGVPCVCSGELVSGCDPPGWCHPSRIPGRLAWQLGACSQFGGGGCRLWGWVCLFLALAASLPWAGDGPINCPLANLWYSLRPLFCELPSSALG